MTNTRDFVLVSEDAAGRPAKLESFRLADSPDEFHRRLEKPVHGLPPQAVRALAALSDRCNQNKRSRARVPTLARASGRSVRAWHRAFVALVVAGWAWSRGRCRGLGREQVRADSGKRHTPFRRMAELCSSSRKGQNESDPAVPGGCDTLIQAQQRTARRPTQDELLAMPRAARVAALEACIA